MGRPAIATRRGALIVPPGSRTRHHAFTHGTSCPSRHRRTRPKYYPTRTLGLEEWLSLNAKYAKIWPKITVKKALPPDSREWEGKPDKLQYFSPNPGAGD
jgi:hypothetical protein